MAGVLTRRVAPCGDQVPSALHAVRFQNATKGAEHATGDKLIEMESSKANAKAEAAVVQRPLELAFEAQVIESPGQRMEIVMGEATDKLKAAGNKVAGGVKDAVGKATDNAKLQAEGKAQKAKGTAQDVAGTVKGKLGDNI